MSIACFFFFYVDTMAAAGTNRIAYYCYCTWLEAKSKRRMDGCYITKHVRVPGYIRPDVTESRQDCFWKDVRTHSRESVRTFVS
ncbi:hypothetical protein HDK77DRAFT_453679 [Phyllosticta capitalensis]